jgi:hypothetical protein
MTSNLKKLMQLNHMWYQTKMQECNKKILFFFCKTLRFFSKFQQNWPRISFILHKLNWNEVYLLWIWKKQWQSAHILIIFTLRNALTIAYNLLHIFFAIFRLPVPAAALRLDPLTLGWNGKSSTFVLLSLALF